MDGYIYVYYIADPADDPDPIECMKQAVGVSDKLFSVDVELFRYK